MLFSNKLFSLAPFCQYIIMDNGKGQEKQPEAVAVNSQENIQDNERAVGMQSRMQSKGYQSG